MHLNPSGLAKAATTLRMHLRQLESISHPARSHFSGAGGQPVLLFIVLLLLPLA
jgi:hypothetical protein